MVRVRCWVVVRRRRACEGVWAWEVSVRSSLGSERRDCILGDAGV